MPDVIRRDHDLSGPTFQRMPELVKILMSWLYIPRLGDKFPGSDDKLLGSDDKLRFRW